MSKHGYYIFWREEVEDFTNPNVTFITDTDSLLRFINQPKFIGRDDQDRWDGSVYAIDCVVKGFEVPIRPKTVKIVRELEIGDD